MIEVFTQTVYRSTPSVDKDLFACNLNGLATLNCQGVGVRPEVLSPNGVPIRSVTLAGVFAPASWATGGKTLSPTKAAAMYLPSDFTDMAKLGLNTVLIPITLDIFAENTSHHKTLDALTTILDMASSANLQVILALSGDPNSNAQNDAVRQATMYASSHKDVVLGVQLPGSTDNAMLEAARTVSATMPLFLPVNLGQLQDLQVPDEYTFAALDVGHTSTVADIASSSSLNDRMKLFYHEGISCMTRSPIDFSACYRQVPVFVSSGFDLAIDDCVFQGFSDKWNDYGQCDRFDETIGSPWWHRHRQSFAARQLFAYETGLGWNFGTYKILDGNDDDSSTLITKPEQLLALKNVAAAGLFPSLSEDYPAQFACLNGPEPDFLLGDATLEPTPAPPPDCYPGWWNASIDDCTYWVPPATEPPVPCPVCDEDLSTPEPCPVCEDCPTVDVTSSRSLAAAAGGGTVVGLVIGAWIAQMFKRRREGYTAIPN